MNQSESDVVSLLLNASEFVDEVLECLVHPDVLVSLVAHLLDIYLFEKCTGVDALNELHDGLLQSGVFCLHLLVLFDNFNILLGKYLALGRQALLLLSQLRELLLLGDDQISVRKTPGVHLLVVFLGELKVLLGRNL